MKKILQAVGILTIAALVFSWLEDVEWVDEEEPEDPAPDPIYEQDPNLLGQGLMLAGKTAIALIILAVGCFFIAMVAWLFFFPISSTLCSILSEILHGNENFEACLDVWHLGF